MKDVAESDEIEEQWLQVQRDEQKLTRLLEMQMLAQSLKGEVDGLKGASGTTAPTGNREFRTETTTSKPVSPKYTHRGRRVIGAPPRSAATQDAVNAEEEDYGIESIDDGSGNKVVVVEYPKSPSIPSLISAVADMFKKVDLNDRKRPVFEEEGWPSDNLCKSITDRQVRFMSTWMSVAAKNVTLGDHIDLTSELGNPSLYKPPLCTAPINTKKVHTLEHLKGMASRSNLTMLPELALKEVVRRVHEPAELAGHPRDNDMPPPMPISEVGERTRLALEKNVSSQLASVGVITDIE